MSSDDAVKLSSAEKIFTKIRESMDYESIYHTQAYEAYNLYSSMNNIFLKNRFSSHLNVDFTQFFEDQRQSNVYYANVETLKGLILPQVPSLSVTLNPSKKSDDIKDDKAFYDICCNILSVLVKSITDNLKAGVWDAFKLDYIVTGRGVLWVDSFDNDEEKKNFAIEHVRWQDFAMDSKPVWDAVNWVSRRRLFTKRQFLKTFDVVESKVSGLITLGTVYSDLGVFDSLGDNSLYIEVWEYWDKPTLTKYYVSRQYNVDADDDNDRFVISKEKYADADANYFFPTPNPPLLMYNGLNLLPFSDVWNYINELLELSNITKKRASLINSLHLRGYTDTARATVINSLSNSTRNGLGRYEEDDTIVSVPGFTPSPQDPLIYYVDNMPRLQLLDFLQKEYQFLVERIYSLTGISEQMRNITAGEDDESATSIRLKSKFGSRRLKEHQQRLLDYWIGILKILVHRIAQTATPDYLKDIFTYKFRDSNSKDLQNVVFEKTDVFNQLQQVQSQIQELESQLQQQPDMQGQQPDEQAMPQPNGADNG
jgi:hypothetical protein